MKKERRGIHLIAELAKVSIGTVDRALHGRGGIKESTRQRVLQVVRQIGYTPNLAARALSVAKAGARIGVCMPREINFFYDQLWSGVLDESRGLAQLGIQFVNRPVPVLGEGGGCRRHAKYRGSWQEDRRLFRILSSALPWREGCQRD